jgi:hypothetical protein
MAYVAGVDHERGLCGQCTNCADRLLECAAHVRIGWLVEADMAVNVLQEGKPTDVLRERLEAPADAEPGHVSEFESPEYYFPVCENLRASDALRLRGLEPGWE